MIAIDAELESLQRDSFSYFLHELFTHQLSHVWIDFCGIQDAFMRAKGIDYFENSRRATYVQREYAIDNPLKFAHYGFKASFNPTCPVPCGNPHGWVSPWHFGLRDKLIEHKQYIARYGEDMPENGSVNGPCDSA